MKSSIVSENFMKVIIKIFRYYKGLINEFLEYIKKKFI